MNLSKYKVEKSLILTMILFFIISLISIYSAGAIDSANASLYIKQLMWYICGTILVFFIMFIGNDFFIRNSFIFYILGNIFLLLLLFFARPINDAKCWFEIKGIGTIQPSEFMKIILILFLSKQIEDFRIKYNNPTILEEFLFLLKIMILVAIPSILTFLEPDTGVVLIYFLITIIMLFVGGIRFRWFLLLIILCSLGIGTLLFIYFQKQEMFIKLFGTSFFLRVDRLLDWSNKSGFQLEHGLFSIGSAGLFGHGLKKAPLYFPEAHTDFIFAVYASNFGLLGSLFLLCLIIFFDLKLIQTALRASNNIYKYITAGIVGMLIYQQIQNIGMTFGVMPITGITLPFISYGGSSLLSYMFMVGVLFNISNHVIKYRHKYGE